MRTRLFLCSAAAVLTVSAAAEPLLPPNEACQIAYDSVNGVATLSWSSRDGASCFVQFSTCLSGWQYMPALVLGTGTLASIDKETNAPRLFMRLYFTTDPFSDDLDGDGIDNLLELPAGLDPLNPDFDGDGMFDGWELQYGYDAKAPNDPNADPDQDGVTNLAESQVWRNPNAGAVAGTDTTVALQVFTLLR